MFVYSQCIQTLKSFIVFLTDKARRGDRKRLDSARMDAAAAAAAKEEAKI